MANSVSHQLNTGVVAALLASPTGGVAKDLLKRGLRVESKAKLNLGGGAGIPRRVDTGRLRASIRTIVLIIDGKPAVRIGTGLRYARWVHDGTGLYGPLHHYILPKNKKVLRWKTKGPKQLGGGAYVFARRSSGMKPNPFLKNALSAAKY